jgi:hypothetical protein
MRITILTVIAAVFLSAGGAGMAATNTKNWLQSHIYHVSDADFQKAPCIWKTARLDTTIAGKKLLEVFPIDVIKAVEVQGDEVTMPAALIVHTVMEARFEKLASHPISVLNAAAARISLKDGNCLQFNFLLDPADGSVSNVQTNLGTLKIAEHPECKKLIPHVKTGMTRQAVEAMLGQDGGLSVPFKYERYVLLNSKRTAMGEMIKMNFAFKPAGMSDAVYYLGKWVAPQQSPQDVLMRMSPPYIETPFSD